MKALHILTLDDDRDQLAMLAEYFGYCHQCTTCPARDSDEALAQLRRRSFDVLLTDINHPGMDGLELTQLVRRLGGPPVIIMSGYSYPGSRRHAFANGARAYLDKPFNLARLSQVVSLVVEKGLYYIGAQ